MNLFKKAGESLKSMVKERQERADAKHNLYTVRTDGSSVGFHPLGNRPVRGKMPQMPEGTNQQPQQPQQQTFQPQFPPKPDATSQPGNYTSTHMQTPPEVYQPTGQLYTPTYQPPAPEARQPVNPPQPVPDNIRPMQGMAQDKNGQVYRYIMRSVMVHDMVSACEVISFMRNEEAVVMNVEDIADDMQMDRCMDLIYGAACALNCTMSRVAARCLYVITPRAVTLQADIRSIQRSDQEFDRRWNNAYQPQMTDAVPRQRTYAAYGQQGGWPEGYANSNAGGFERRVANRTSDQSMYTDFAPIYPRK